MTILHVDTSKSWLYYSDIFGVAMLVIAITGMFIAKGEHSFNVNWYAPNAKWLKRVLLKKQVVTFPKLSEVQHG